MRDLDVVNLYEQKDDNDVDKFFENTSSNINIKTEIEKVKEDTSWIDIIEETVPHIDSIYRNTNRFIVNEEEIVKIEIARRITVDSIKHLSKHTNFIQSIDTKTGDVVPSKILNINKEESYDTYENRVIYTLIQNTRYFVDTRKKLIEARASLQGKDSKQFDYSASSNFMNDNVNINLHIDSNKLGGGKNTSQELLKRIELVEQKITDLTSSDIYRILAKSHISLVRPPIKKTNVILKNVHFQYAMKLWNFLQDNMEDKTKQISEKNETADTQELKRLADKTFLLNYVALKTLNRENDNSEKNKKKKNKMAVIKYRNTANINEIQRIFKEHIEKYLHKVEK